MTNHPAQPEIRPILCLVSPGEKSADVLTTLERDRLSFAVVADPDNGEVLGVVQRAALQNACPTAGHSPADCTVWRHLKRDVDVCTQDEPDKVFLNVDEVEVGSGRLRAIREKARERFPLIVVDGERRPVGLRNR